MADGLRLKAEGPEDLQILSAALQDAVMKIGDVSYDAKTRRFTAMVNRFRWEKAGKKGPYERIRAALSFDDVRSVKSTHVRRADKDAVASILSLAFDADKEPPSGKLRVVLSGGGEIRLDVECVDGVLIDMGEAWTTPRKPYHGKL